jgi:hypothetical protein
LGEVHAVDVVGTDDDDDLGRSSSSRLRLWKIASALPRYQFLSTRCWAGTGAT